MSNAAGGPINVFVLGDARIETPVGVIEPTAEVVFATALYLLLEGGSSRRILEKILWPSVAPQTASHRLRQTLLKLRRCGLPIEGKGNGRLTVAGPITMDFELFRDGSEDLASEGDRELAVLPEYDPTFSREYEFWIDDQKTRIASSLTPRALSSIAKNRAMGNWSTVEQIASRLLRAAPLNEEATLALAEAFAMRGAKIESVRILDAYLAQAGRHSQDLQVQATTLRKRIVDRAPMASHRLESSAMLERGQMMEHLGTLLSSAKRGNGRACFVWGEAGIGKSRLLTEFSIFASIQGVAVHRVTCRPSDAMRPLSVFFDLVPLLRTMRGAIGCSADTIHYLDRLTKRKPLDDFSASDQADPQFVYARIETALLDLVDAVSEERTLLVQIDDIQFIDQASLGIVRHLVDWCCEHRVLLAFTSRERPLWIEGSRTLIEELRLPPLSPDSAAQVIRCVVASANRLMSPPYLEWCVRIAEGNPFFLEEMAKQWLETGEEHRAPRSISTVIEERISRLSPDSLRLLQVSATLEDHSTFELIESVLDEAPHAMMQALDTLTDAGMILGEHRSEGNQSYLIRPRHDLIAFAALKRLAPPTRAFLHRRVATVLEKELSGENATALLWDSAKHWQLAGDSTRALRLARSCGFHLLELGLPAAAADAFQRALQFCSCSTETIDILRAQATSYNGSNSFGSLLQTAKLIRSLEAQSTREDILEHDELELLALRARWKTDDGENALIQLKNCINDSQASPDHRVKAATMALMLQDVTCRHEEMKDTFGVIEAISTLPGVARVDVLESELVYHSLCGSMQTAVQAAEQLLQIKRVKEDPGEVFRHLLNASITYRIAGQFNDSIGCLLEAIDIAKAHRLPKCLARALPMLAHLALERGLNEEAALWSEQMDANTVEPDDIYVNLDRSSVRIRLAIATGRKIDAGELKQPSLNRSPRTGQPYTYAYALYAATKLVSGHNLNDAEITDFENAYRKSRRSVAQAFGTYVLYGCLERARRHKDAAELLKDYHRNYRRETWPAKQLFLQLMAQFRIEGTEAIFDRAN